MRGRLQLMSSARVAGSSAKDDWQTPPAVLERVRRIGPIALDPCTGDDNPVAAAAFFTVADNGLVQSWGVGGLAYVNPPYAKVALWAAKIATEAQLGVPIIALVAARPDTRWWRALWTEADVVAFWRGRLTFVGAESCAPFPSALFGLGISQRRFRRAFGDVAEVVVP